MLNRFFEANPTNLVAGAALLARPGTELLKTFGPGNVRALFSQPGGFNGDLFVVVDNTLYRYAEDGTVIDIAGVVLGNADPSMTVVSGAGYERLFIADGLLLQYYGGGSHSSGTLTLTPVSPPNIVDQTVNIGGVHYQWSTTVNIGTPNGSALSPYLVLQGANDAESLANLAKAIAFAGLLGITYSNTLPGPHPAVQLRSVGSDSLHLYVEAIGAEVSGDTIVTVVTPAAELNWGGATLSGGGNHALGGIAVPDGAGVTSLTGLSSYVIFNTAKSQRFYWIEPGEVVVDPLNFAEAESEPDEIVNVQTVNDQLWLLGLSTTEAWYATGDPNSAFAPINGRAFARGALEGTTVQVKDQVILVGLDGIVWAVGEGMQRISTHGIEERVRRQLRREAGL